MRRWRLGRGVEPAPWRGCSGGERELDAIVAGANPPNPAELIESEAMGELLAQLGERYDLVVIDTAPTGVVSDAFPLLHKVDGVIVVARIGNTTRDAAERLREQLDRLEAPVLGVVANAVKLSRRRKYGYGYYGYYGYGYGPGPAEQPTGAEASTSPGDTKQS
jgi:tyrosine-protein kinase